MAAVVALTACSGEVGSPGRGPADASTMSPVDAADAVDATVTGETDAASDDGATRDDAGAMEDAGCGANVEGEIADSGAFTDSCIACYDTSCSAFLAMCDQDCRCPNAVNQALQCVALGGTEQSCIDVVIPIIGAASVLQLYQCSALCKSECHQDSGAATTDAGGDGGDGGDAAAPMDAAIADSGADADASN